MTASQASCTPTSAVDLNADLGEGFGPWSMGDDAEMLDIVTSANVACGGHAGDADTMYATLTRAARKGVRVGAHPGFADRQGFGRRLIAMAPDEIARMIAAQIGSLQAIAALAGSHVAYVKLHGALANLAARDTTVAAAVVNAVQTLDSSLAILAISGTTLEDIARHEGCPVFSEVFADRAYTPEGQLVLRSEPGAVLHDADAVVDRMLFFLDTGLMPTVDDAMIPLAVDSICVHGDTPGAVDLARRLRAGLDDAGVTVAPFRSPTGVVA